MENWEELVEQECFRDHHGVFRHPATAKAFIGLLLASEKQRVMKEVENKAHVLRKNVLRDANGKTSNEEDKGYERGVNEMQWALLAFLQGESEV